MNAFSFAECRPGRAGAPHPAGIDRSTVSETLASLLLRAGAGDAGAFRQVYDLHAPRLYAVALRVTRQDPLACDAVRDAFLQLWQNARRFDPTRGAAGAWLLSLVRYRALDIVRAHARHVRR